jgi:hypothetical protein
LSQATRKALLYGLAMATASIISGIQLERHHRLEDEELELDETTGTYKPSSDQCAK